MQQSPQDYPTESPPRAGRAEKVCAFLNRSSGERAAAEFVREQLIVNLGKDMVFDLFPTPGQPPAIEEAKAFLLRCQPDLVIVAGGDGTVSLSMDITDALRDAGKIGPLVAAVAVLPMGTGNDLSRTLGFGSGYTKPLVSAESKFKAYLGRLRNATVKKIDRYSLDIYVVPRGEQEPAGLSKKRRTSRTENVVSDVNGVQHAHLSATEQLREDHSPQGDSEMIDREAATRTNDDRIAAGDAPMYSTKFMNYFSVGFDAEVAAKFSEFRDKHPKACSSRVLNKMWYGWFGCMAMFETSTFNKKRCLLRVDGQPVKISSSSKAVIITNVLTYSGGAVLWSDRRNRFATPAVDDHKVEVMEMDGVWHMIGVGTKARSAGKLGQGAHVVIRVPANYVMQYDGEPIDTMGANDRDAWVDIRYLRQSLGSCMADGDFIVEEEYEVRPTLTSDEEV